jgi:hypothetical protein
MLDAVPASSTATSSSTSQQHRQQHIEYYPMMNQSSVSFSNSNSTSINHSHNNSNGNSNDGIQYNTASSASLGLMHNIEFSHSPSSSNTAMPPFITYYAPTPAPTSSSNNVLSSSFYFHQPHPSAQGSHRSSEADISQTFTPPTPSPLPLPQPHQRFQETANNRPSLQTSSSPFECCLALTNCVPQTDCPFPALD